MSRGMERAPVRAVLFDLDGTLLDTAPDMVGAMNALRAEEGLPPIDFATARAQVSHGSNGLMRIGFPHAQGERLEGLRERFLNLYRARLIDETGFFPGGEAMLEHIEGAAMPWGVVTNKPGWLARPLLAGLGLDRRAGCLVSGDTLPVRKPDPAMARYCIDWFSASTPRTLLVGDSAIDAATARNAGIAAWLLPHGYNGGAPLAQAAADRVVADFGALQALLLPEVALSA